MKNGKAPTREQKKIMRAHGLVPENWLVVKNLPDSLEVVSRVSLKKAGGKPKQCELGDYTQGGNGKAKPEYIITFNDDIHTIIVVWKGI